MRTKDKIMQEGLRQFNENGLERVSIRSIADALGISPGNLTYHFKNTDVILYNLYLQLVEQINVSVGILQSKDLSIPLFFQLTQSNFRIFWNYRFLFLEFVAVCRRVPQLRDHLRELMALRRIQFRRIIERMIVSGLVREEWVEGLYDHLILQSLIFSDAWVTNAEVHLTEEGSGAIPFYADLYASVIVPFLTEEGLRQYGDWRRENPAPEITSRIFGTGPVEKKTLGDL